MIRSTRLFTRLNSPELLLRFGSLYPQNNLTFTNIRSSSHRFPKISTSIATNSVNPLTPKPSPSPPAMDPYQPESSDPPPPPPVSDEFVHIENPNPNLGPLSESIVDVAAELRDHDDDDAAGEVAVSGGGDEPDRRELPEELSRSVVVLTCESTAESGSCDVYLVGTAHVSQESCNEVQAVIRFLKPEVVFLELCSSRVAVLTPQNLKVPTMGDMIESWKKKHNLFGILYSWFLAKVAEKLEVFPGSEFRVAFEEARAYGGKVILGDRPVQITLRRTWAKMPLWHKIKLVYSLLFQAVFLPSSETLTKMLKEMDDVDMLTLVIQEMSKEFPTLMETLVHERDQYMSSTLLKVASEHSSVVAVVGKGHLQGIKKHWKQPVELREILEMPSQKAGVSAVKVITSLGVAVAGAAIISGIYFTCKK